MMGTSAHVWGEAPFTALLEEKCSAHMPGTREWVFTQWREWLEQEDDEDNGCGVGGLACRIPLFPSDHLHHALYRLAVQSARHITVRSAVARCPATRHDTLSAPAPRPESV